MKLLATTALVSAVSAASLESRQRNSIEIGEFAASCIPHSTFCSYSFTAISDPSLPASHCSEMLQGPDRLPNVTDGSCVDNPAYTWTMTRNADEGIDFTLSFPFNSRSNATYCRSLPKDWFTIDDNGSVQDERYTGPPSISVSISNCPRP